MTGVGSVNTPHGHVEAGDDLRAGVRPEVISGVTTSTRDGYLRLLGDTGSNNTLDRLLTHG